ncbi:acyltransferase family protein [Prosthecomicrobium sp. N25]|uniref:acyltransferase family protein n=1 Tax=Prosthecomicrobium sp. N25 TaxID=3129254 RepID=UPI003076E7DF
MKAQTIAGVGHGAPNRAAAAQGKFEALDSLRGVAAVLVALFHFLFAGYHHDLAIVRNGSIGVPMFFVLSGFVVCHAYARRLARPDDLGTFMLRRFGRLYPLHLFTLGLVFAFEVVKLVLVSAGVKSGQPPFSGANDLPSLAANLALLQAIIPFDTFTWNGVSWSISTEFYTYMVFGLVLLAAGPAGGIAQAVLAAASGLLLLAVETWMPQLPVTAGRGFLLCLFGFFTGCCVYRAWVSAQARGLRTGTLAELAATALVAGTYAFHPFGDVGAVMVFALAIFVFAFDGGAVSALLRTRLPRFLGRISYSIYMMHAVILTFIYGIARAAGSVLKIDLYAPGTELFSFGPPWVMDLVALAVLGVIVAASAWTYAHIEAPWRDRFNAWAGNRKLRTPVYERA